MNYRFNPPPGWDVPPGFTPDESWRPPDSWPPAPADWAFWTPEVTPEAAELPKPGHAAGASTPSQRMSGMFRSLKSKAHDEDWMGRAKAAASQAQASAQQAAHQAAAMAKQRDEATLAKAGAAPEGALWRGVSHEAGRNSIVTLYPDRIERTKPVSKLSVTGMLTGGPEDLEVIPTRSVSSVQVKRGPWYHDVTVYASGNTIVLSVDADEAEKLRGLIMDQLLQGGTGPAGPATGTPAPDADAIMDQIRKLGTLRDEGLITAEEFDVKKADLLGRL